MSNKDTYKIVDCGNPSCTGIHWFHPVDIDGVVEDCMECEVFAEGLRTKLEKE